MGPSPIIWADVQPGSVTMGSDDRSILFGGIGPRHEVSLGYRYKISVRPMSLSEADAIIESMSAEVASESEWELAYSRGLISGDGNSVEILADHAENYWGKQCDGRPLVKGEEAPRMLRVWRSGTASPSFAFPGNSEGRLEGAKIRLVIRDSPRWSPNPPGLPLRRDNLRLLLEEALISLVIGIIPSFFWAYYNASPSYISEGWLNLIFGGVFFGALTGIFWRPRQPTWYHESGEMIPRNRRD